MVSVRRSGWSSSAVRSLSLLILALLLGGVAAAWGLPSGPTGGPVAHSGLPASPLNGRGGSAGASLARGPLVAVTPSTFWSVVAQTSCASCIATNRSVTHFLADTPFTWVRYGQSTDECNISAGKLYGPAGTSTTGCGYDLSALRSWCASQTPHCHAILDLPGENNNSAEDAAIAQWIVKVVGFQPTYWSIGNEPTGWTHYGIPWTQWRTTDHAGATPMAYAFDVKAAIAAVSAVDPGARFIGIEAACACNTVWFQDVARVDGAAIAAIALHNYPSSGSTTESLSQFYAPLASASNITSSVASVRAAIAGDCGRCGTLPLFVNEYNAGPGWAPSNFGGSYANAVFLAASVAQALLGNVTQFTVFNLQSGSPSSYGFSLLDARGSVGPPGVLFSQVLRHLAVGEVYADRIGGTARNVWAVTTKNATTESLLVVNANPTTNLSLSIPLGLLPGLSGAAYRWGPALAAPKIQTGAIALSWAVPAQGILLLDEPLSKIGGISPAGSALVPPAAPTVSAAAGHASDRLQAGPGAVPGAGTGLRPVARRP